MVDDLLRQVLRDIREPLGLEFVAYVEGTRRHSRVRTKAGDVDDTFLLSLQREALTKPDSSTSNLLTDSRAEGQLIVTRLTDLVALPAVLVIGPKTTGEPFSDEDFQMIETIGGMLSTALGRLMLLEELQDKNQELMGLNTRLVEVEEQERARISGYLHDEPLQKVSYVLSQYRERQLSEDLSDVLDEAVSDLRAITATLSPAILMDLGLARSVEWLVAEADGRSDFEMDLRISGEEQEGQLSGPAQLVAYRLVQESLTNCQKHASASMVWVSLEYENNGLLISVEDNGTGAPEGPDGFINKADSLGLLSMRQRVESQNGFLALENRESRGFSVRARLPFDGGSVGPSVVVDQ
jgi:signal transduction histidine kinase